MIGKIIIALLVVLAIGGLLCISMYSNPFSKQFLVITF